MIKPQKILILVPDLNLHGGVANYYKILKLNNIPNITYFTVNSKNQNVIVIAFRLIFNYFSFAYKLVTHSYKLIHLNPSLGKRSFYRDSLFIIIARLLNKKTLVFFRGWLEDFEKSIKSDRFKKFIFNISYAKANSFIVLSNSFRTKLLELGVPSTAHFFIETTVADSSFLTDYNFQNKIINYKERVVFLFLSRIIKEKGIYIAIEAYKKFLQEFPKRQSTLIIAGDGPELKRAKCYVQKLKIPEIKFTGHVNGDLKKKILLEPHILLFPSYSEGLPNAILEGMLYGMPIISRVTGGIPDIVKQNVNGFITRSLEPQVFANFISLLNTDIELYKTMAENNHKIALEKFTKEKVLNRILKIYDCL